MDCLRPPTISHGGVPSCQSPSSLQILAASASVPSPQLDPELPLFLNPPPTEMVKRC